MWQSDVGDGGVEYLHERGEGDCNRYKPRIDGGPSRSRSLRFRDVVNSGHGLIQTHRGFDRHAGAQLIKVFLAGVESYADGKALNHLHVIAGGILRRQHAGAGTGNGGHAFYGSIEYMAQGVNVDSNGLARVHAGQLRFLEIGGDPEAICLDDHEQLLAFGDACANLGAALGNNSRYRRVYTGSNSS